MSNQYDDPLDQESLDGEPDIPEESTRPTSSTPVTPSTPVRRRPVNPDVTPNRDAYSRPAIPREQRQARPMAGPPPTPPQGFAVQEPRSLPPRSRPRPQPQVPRSKRDNGFYLPWWSLVIMLVFVGSAAVGAFAVFDTISRNVTPAAYSRTPIVLVVTATYTVGPPASATPIPPPATDIPPAILPTVPATLTLPPGDFKIGGTVEVIDDVGINGLRIRSGPGTDATTRFVAPAKTRFTLKSGPQYASNLEWWEVQDPTNPQVSGWAARQFLQPITGQ